MVTGNLGYIGSVLTEYLVKNGNDVIGFDVGYFKNCVLERKFSDIKTIEKDIREITEADLSGIDCIVHLAALSNDPIGELEPSLTYEINRDAAVETARLAKKSGVKRFVFISTQSIYGISSTDSELGEDDSSKNPQTAYAKSKWDAEQEIMKMKSKDFTVLALRPSTVFGWSPRLRSDIVFNNLVLSGLKDHVINVHSDGSPWRPIVHVLDLCEAILNSINAQTEMVNGEAINIGNLGGNFTVKQIAEAAQSCLQNVEIRYNTEHLTDPRSYKVSFLKAERLLGFRSNSGLIAAGNVLVEKIRENGLDVSEIMGPLTNRLSRVAELRRLGTIDDQLRF
jgi:nucleoside-diphosphate-sugar epimerase